jgi:Sigma-70 region 2
MSADGTVQHQEPSSEPAQRSPAGDVVANGSFVVGVADSAAGCERQLWLAAAGCQPGRRCPGLTWQRWRQPFRRRGSLTDVEPSRHDGLAQLHQRYYPELVRLAFALTGDWSLAEELGQEAFVRAWRSWGTVRRKQSAPAYLRATVINLARTSLRQRLREISGLARGRHPTPGRGRRQPGRAAGTRHAPPA